MFARAGAQFFFLRRSTHACVARTLRPPCTAVVMSVSAWPFRQGASHRCAGFHALQRISETELVEARSGDATNKTQTKRNMGVKGTEPVRGYWDGSAKD